MTEKKKSKNFTFEVLNLFCEWEDCSVNDSEIESFISHIIQEHLGKLREDDLNCHWKDCEGFTENLAELRRHILLHAFHSKIKCHGESLQFHKQIPECLLSSHSHNIIPELPEPLICLWDNCLEEFECPEYFYRHVDYHSEGVCKTKDVDCHSEGVCKTKVICSWQDCNRSFADLHKLKDHLRSHTQEKLIACPTCGGMFASRTKFFDHIQRQLPVEENDPANTFICEYCSRKMNSERLLRDHMRHHINHYKCTYCDMTCPTPSALQLHMAYRHSDNKPHACQYCDYRCKSENDLRKHLETHSLIASYKCPVDGCSYATRYQTSYSNHYRKKHEGKQPAKYSCHICEKVCTRGNYLTKHLINHHKFRWPSGHCRFRYRLHEDGLYRLQTVRYESLELSQTMMSQSAENIDDPDNILMNDECEDVDQPKSFCTDESPVTNEEAIADDSAIPESTLEYQQSSSLTEPSLTSTFEEHPEQEPVLINIVDADSTSESGGSLLVIKTSQPIISDERRSVQIITKDSSGRVVLETAEIITQYEYVNG